MAPIRSARSNSVSFNQSQLQGFWDHTADPKAPTWIYLLEDLVKLQFGPFRTGPRFNPNGVTAEENLRLACQRLNINPHHLKPFAFKEKKVFCPVCNVVVQDTSRTVDRHVKSPQHHRNLAYNLYVEKECLVNRSEVHICQYCHTHAKAREDLLLKHEQQCASNPANSPPQLVPQTVNDARLPQAEPPSYHLQSPSSASSSSSRSSISSIRSSVSSSSSMVSISSSSSVSSTPSLSPMAPSIYSNLSNRLPYGQLTTSFPAQKEGFDVPEYLDAQFMPSDYSSFLAPSYSPAVPAQHYPRYAAQSTTPVRHTATYYAPGTRSHAVGADLMPSAW